MEEERKILSTTEKARLCLVPKHGMGFQVAFILTGPLIWGALFEASKRKAISFGKGSFFNSVENISDVTPGEFKDIVNNLVTLKELILTNKNFHFLYEKGTFSKKLRAMGFPLQGAKTVTLIKNKEVDVGYEVLQEGKKKPYCFTLGIVVSDAANWAREIQNLINLPPPPPP